MMPHPTDDLIPLPHLPRELGEIVEPGQTIPGHRNLYTKVTNGDMPMIIFDRGRWKCPRPELSALAAALGLRLKRSRGRPAAAKPQASVRTGSRNRAA